MFTINVARIHHFRRDARAYRFATPDAPRSRGARSDRDDDDRAFKAREIASQIGVDEGAVSTALSRLKDRSSVEHKATYWAITDDETRLEGYSGYERATTRFNERLGEEDNLLNADDVSQEVSFERIVAASTAQ